MKKKIVACFDFDGTITKRDSLLPFLFFAKGALKALISLSMELPSLIGFILKMKDRQQVKEAILKRFFSGVSEEKMRAACRSYAEKKLPLQVKQEALDAIKKHKQNGDRLVLISASIDAYLEPWAKNAGFDDLLASKLEIKNGLVTGKIAGKNCRAEEKVLRLQQLLGKLEDFEIYAYGDSRGDLELLKIADHPYYRTFH